MSDEAAPNLAPPPPPLPPTFAAAPAGEPDDDDDSLKGIDLTQFGIGPSLEGADDANYRRPADGGGDDRRRDEEAAELRQRLNQAEDMIKRLWEQMPRRVPASDDNHWIPVKLLENGTGADGSGTTTATWAYTATSTIAGVVTTYGTAMTPAWPRAKGKMSKAIKGIVCKTTAGTVTLEIAYEVPGTNNNCPPTP